MPFLPACREKLYVSFPPRVILLLQLSARVSSKCHFVQVSAPAIRDHLTFYCELGLFSRRLQLPQFVSIVVANVSTPARGRYLCSPAHSCLQPSLSVQTWLLPCCRRHGTAAVHAHSEHVKHTQTERECRALVVRASFSASCPVAAYSLR